MKNIGLSELLQIATNVAVLIGLIFVGLELQQNNLIARSQTRTDILSGLTDITIPHMEEYGSSRMFKARNGEELTEEELYWLQRRYNLLLRYHENIHYQYRNGLFDESEMASYRNNWIPISCNQYRNQHFNNVKESFHPEFIADVESYLVSIVC